MNTHHEIRDAINILSKAFSPFECHIVAARKSSFSFTVVNQSGIAKHTQRLYPDQYSRSNLQQVIDKAKQAISS